MAAAGADVATRQLQSTGLLAPTITHELGKLPGVVNVGDVAVALAAHLQGQRQAQRVSVR